MEGLLLFRVLLLLRCVDRLALRVAIRTLLACTTRSSIFIIASQAIVGSIRVLPVRTLL